MEMRMEKPKPTTSTTAKAIAKPKSKKPVYALHSPFPAPRWPNISAPDLDTIISLLCDLVSPIGTHKSLHIQKSKGKKARRGQKRKSPPDSPPTDAPPPPYPEILSHLTIGFNSTTRALEELAAISRPFDKPTDTPKGPPIAMVFIPCPPGIQHAHLPILASTASMAFPSDPPVRLVPLAKSSEATLAELLGVPRLGMLGVRAGAPGAEGLLAFVRASVDPVELESNGTSGNWLGAKIEEVKRVESGRA